MRLDDVQVSFVWGIFVFKEAVSSIYLACFAVSLMIIGIYGMSHYSSPEPSVGHGLVTGNDDEPEHSRGARDGYIDVKGDEMVAMDAELEETDSTGSQLETITVLGRKFSRRTLGICAAVFNGTWGGSIMVPMHWAP